MHTLNTCMPDWYVYNADTFSSSEISNKKKELLENTPIVVKLTAGIKKIPLVIQGTLHQSVNHLSRELSIIPDAETESGEKNVKNLLALQILSYEKIQTISIPKSLNFPYFDPKILTKKTFTSLQAILPECLILLVKEYLLTEIPPVTIQPWNGQRTVLDKTYRHLDIGSANYGPELIPKLKTPELYLPSETDSEGNIMHKVLFNTAHRVLQSNSKYTNFIFYLNDISEQGLALAANNLARHLQKENRHIRIETIVGDIYKVNLPKVHSASFMHPFDVFAGHLIFGRPSVQVKITQLFSKIVTTSKTGLLVKEANHTQEMAQKLNVIFAKGYFNSNLLYQSVVPDQSFSDYCFPSGSDYKEASVLIYHVKKASKLQSLKNRLKNKTAPRRRWSSIND